MDFKIILILTALLSFSSASANRIQKPLQKSHAPSQVRKVAQSSNSFEAVNIHYNIQPGNAQTLQNLSLNMTPFGNYIMFEIPSPSRGRKPTVVQMDCRVSADFTKWNCLSACEGGELTVAFHQNLSFEQIRLAPFKIKDRACDGSESDKDRTVSSTKPIVFQIDKMRMSQ